MFEWPRNGITKTRRQRSNKKQIRKEICKHSKHRFRWGLWRTIHRFQRQDANLATTTISIHLLKRQPPHTRLSGRSRWRTRREKENQLLRSHKKTRLPPKQSSYISKVTGRRNHLDPGVRRPHGKLQRTPVICCMSLDPTECVLLWPSKCTNFVVEVVPFVNFERAVSCHSLLKL